MVFRVNKDEYCNSTALDVVRALELDTKEYPHRGQPMQRFLQWSLENLSKQIPPRDMHLSKRMSLEEIALSYLCLRDEFGAGSLQTDLHEGEVEILNVNSDRYRE